MIKSLKFAAVLWTLSAAFSFADTLEETFPHLVNEFTEQERAELERIDFQRGTITVGNDLATLKLTDGYYFCELTAKRNF